MAVVSTMASPTNSVREMVLAASGCCAMASTGSPTARPWPRALPMEATPTAKAAAAMEMTATMTCAFISSMFVSNMTRTPVRRNVRSPGGAGAAAGRLFHALFLHLHRRGDVHHGQHGENVGLNEAGHLAEQLHDDGKHEGRDGQQDGHHDVAAHDVAEKTHRQRQRPRNVAQNVKRKHEPRRLDVGLQPVDDAPGG